MSFNNKLDNIISLFSTALGLNATIFDENGNTISFFGTQYPFYNFCKKLQYNHWNCERQLHNKSGQIAYSLGECYFYLCGGNMMFCTVALTYDRCYRGNVVIGPIMPPGVDKVSLETISVRYSLKEEELKTLQVAQAKIPFKDAEAIHCMGNLLFQMVSGILSSDDLHFTIERARLNYQQSKIGVYLQHMGNDNNLSVVQINQEKNIVDNILKGDIEGAHQSLNKTIARIYFSTSNNIDLARIRMNEIIGITGRSLLKVSAMKTRDEICRIVAIFQQTSLSSTSLSSLSQIADETLDMFIETVKQEMGEKQYNAIKLCIRYIEENYSEKITLDSAAEHCSLSSAYLSQQFKRQVGITFCSYVNNYRIEIAKLRLRESGISLANLAQEMGFESQQYFSRVFKKIVGIPPGMYRKEIAGPV